MLYSIPMMFWILITGLMAMIITLLLRPLVAGDKEHEPIAANAHDTEVYKDQIKEIERDLESGQLSAQEVELARVEISRRLLAASEKSQAYQTSSQLKASRTTKIMTITAIVLLISIVTYFYVGKPQLPDQPLALRITQQLEQPSEPVDPETQRFLSMVEKAEQHLQQNPDDGDGWDALAPVYARLGLLDRSQNAYQRAIQLLGPTALRYAGYGEVITIAAEGQVTPKAIAQFKKALEIEQDNPKALFFLAYAMAQQGKKEEAIAAFTELKSNTPEGAPWLGAVDNQLAILKGDDINPSQFAQQPSQEPEKLGNPDADDIKAASEMNADDRAEMIKSMVASLDEKLKDEPNNLEGWIRLIRSYMVLDMKDKAQAALQDSLKIFTPDTEGGKQLLQIAQQMGIKAQ